MNTIYIIANWKEYPETIKDAKKLATALGKIKIPRGVVSIICPPFPFLHPVGLGIKKVKHQLGAQNLSAYIIGPYTGEVSPKQLTSLGVKYAIIGHSERRAMGETDALILQKIQSALFAGIVPILCVGEQDRDSSVASHEEVRRELAIFSELSKKDAEKVMIAYEPIWAVGAKAKYAASPEDAREMRIYIQKVLADTIGEKSMQAIPILYGGSVNAKNAAEYITVAGMHGLLIGRASLDIPLYADILSVFNTKKI